MRARLRWLIRSGAWCAGVLLMVLSWTFGGTCLVAGVLAEDLSLLSRRLRRCRPLPDPETGSLVKGKLL